MTGPSGRVLQLDAGASLVGRGLHKSGGYVAGLGLGAIAGFAVSCLAVPFMNAATRHDSVRFE